MLQTVTQNGTVTPFEAPETISPQLTAADRCDSCGAQAYIRVVVNSGELMFCAHHGRKYHDKLAPIAESWHDESGRLASEAQP